MNKIILIGFVGKDVEAKNSVASFTLATSESYKNKSGERVTETEWHNIKCFGKLSEFAEKYVKKGEVFIIDGKIKTEKWEAQDGTKKEFRCIYANSISFVPAKSNKTESAKPEPTPTPAPEVNDFEISDPDGDDLSF